jgi:hypothetical protein
VLSFTLVFTGADALHRAPSNGVAGQPCWAPGAAPALHTSGRAGTAGWSGVFGPRGPRCGAPWSPVAPGGGLGRGVLLTTADLTRRRSNPDAENPSWFVFHRFAPSETQSQARYEREVAVNVDQGAIDAELGAPDRLRQPFLPADQGHVLPLLELQLLQRPHDHPVLRTAQSGAKRITSAASEPKATKAAPRAAWPGGEPPGSESVQGSWFTAIDCVVSLPAPGPPTTWIDTRPLQVGAAA